MFISHIYFHLNIQKDPLWVFLVFLYHNWFVVANITIIMINQIEYINYFYKFKQYVSFRLYLRFP